MPVQSKIIAGRARKPPPVPAPKPILKHPSSTRASPDRTSVHRLLNGPKNLPEYAQGTPKVEFTFPDTGQGDVDVDNNEISRGRSRSVSGRSRLQHMDQYGATGEERTVSSSKISAADSVVTATPDSEDNQPQTPRIKHSRIQFRQSIGGDWALKECEVCIQFIISN